MLSTVAVLVDGLHWKEPSEAERQILNLCTVLLQPLTPALVLYRKNNIRQTFRLSRMHLAQLSEDGIQQDDEPPKQGSTV